jgi:outer membrane protein assembly factor BamC
VKPLEVPPELSAPSVDDRYALADPKAQTTYSTYSQKPVPGAAPAPGTPAATVLPRVEGVRLERAGDQRWLVVKGEPAKVWPWVREFWLEAGFSFVKEEPNTGILETEWFEDRSKIPQDIVRNTLGKVIPNAWSTSRRDKYRTRLEKGSEYETTEVFVSNRRVEEVWADEGTKDRTVWAPRPADREAEAEMLQRLVVKFGAVQAQAEAAKTAGTKGARGRRVAQRRDGRERAHSQRQLRPWRGAASASRSTAWASPSRTATARRASSSCATSIRSATCSRGTSRRKASWTSSSSGRRRQGQGAAVPHPRERRGREHVAGAGAGFRGRCRESNTGKKILTLLYDQLK